MGQIHEKAVPDIWAVVHAEAILTNVTCCFYIAFKGLFFVVCPKFL